jgi:hypothetical protein
MDRPVRLPQAAAQLAAQIRQQLDRGIGRLTGQQQETLVA